MPRRPDAARRPNDHPRASGPRPLVLVVDDSIAVRETLADILANDFDVRQVGDSREALERFEAEPIDVALLDILMPGADGLEVLARLRELKPDVPVIVVSGLDRAGPAASAMCLGARDYLTKPVDAAILLAAVTSAVRGRSGHADRHAAGPPNPWPPRAEVILVGDDVPALAGIKIALMPLPVRISSVMVAALQHLTTDQPAFVVVEEPPLAGETGGALRAVRAASPRSKLAVGSETTASRPVAESRPRPGLWPEADLTLGKPYDLNEVRAWVTIARGRGTSYEGSLSHHVVRALHYICRHYATATVDAAATAARVSPGHLAHAFRAELDTTFWDCVTIVRLEVAKDLLARTPHKLAHIAKLAGFCDAPHLSRVFSRYCACSPHCSPRAYRNKMLRFVGPGRLADEPVA